jgi:hypothetical protein
LRKWDPPTTMLLLSPESAMPPAWRFPFIGDAIRRRATAADIATKLGNHSFRATGITDNVRSTLYATWELAEMGQRCTKNIRRLTACGISPGAGRQHRT